LSAETAVTSFAVTNRTPLRRKNSNEHQITYQISEYFLFSFSYEKGVSNMLKDVFIIYVVQTEVRQ
jgi:hypothetical protein